MPSDTFRFCRKFLGVILGLSLSMISQRLQALKHKWTYKETISPKNVVVLGGSFCGLFLAKRLMETLPTGYRVVLIEKNSHFNYSFNFPRVSVMPGYEHQAFVPYNKFSREAPAGIFKHIHGIATKITNDVIYLESGDKIEYTYLAVATGSSQTPPVKVVSSEKAEACSEMRAFQERIKAAKKIGVIGGGAVGIEMASDIKTFYPETDVTLVHSRPQLLPHFGRRLHDHVVEVFENFGIDIVFQERPQILPGIDGTSSSLLFSDGRTEEFDLIIPCTGQKPNSTLIAGFACDSVSKETKRILVKPTLQLLNPHLDRSHIFAIGDVAETKGPKMARAGMFQAEVVQENIAALINGQQASKVYAPMDVEGSIKLTLGKTKWVMYMDDDDGSSYLWSGNNGKLALEVKQGWKFLNADINNSMDESV